jgi:hypothetical protein
MFMFEIVLPSQKSCEHVTAESTSDKVSPVCSKTCLMAS